MKKESFQPHSTIPVSFLLDGEMHQMTAASLNGNNAAWLCVCGYRLPLIWSGRPVFAGKGVPPKPPKPVWCPECQRLYDGVTDGDTIPTAIKEVSGKRSQK